MKARILVVDDDPKNQATVEAVLAREGYELHFASDGSDAIDLAQRLHPDVILLDVMMPGVDGFTVCRTLRSHPELRLIPIIMLTALDDSTARIEGLRAGADDYVAKPFEREELRARVRTTVTLNRYRVIAEERARYQHLFEQAPAGIVLLDANFTVKAANRRALAMFAPEDSAATRETPEIPPALTTWARTSTGRETSEPIALEDIRGTRWIQVTRETQPGSEDVLLVFADVTSEVQARRTVEETNRNLDQLVAARTRELEDSNRVLLSYASFVSHDLRGPLSGVLGFVELLLTYGDELSQDFRGFVREIQTGANTMSEMITGMLEMAKQESSGSRKSYPPSPLEPVIRRVLSHLRAHYINKWPDITVLALPQITINPLVAERIFYNLLSNAIKYSAGQAAPMVEIGTASRNGSAPEVYVRDNGVGFDAAEGERLFQAFNRMTTATEFEGLGLGLSLVNQLVQAHGGTLRAESTPGQGATFYVSLPGPAAE